MECKRVCHSSLKRLKSLFKTSRICRKSKRLLNSMTVGLMVMEDRRLEENSKTQLRCVIRSKACGLSTILSERCSHSQTSSSTINTVYSSCHPINNGNFWASRALNARSAHALTKSARRSKNAIGNLECKMNKRSKGISRTTSFTSRMRKKKMWSLVIQCSMKKAK